MEEVIVIAENRVTGIREPDDWSLPDNDNEI
jgi:hypothetical protein